jgi:hypothetical protein
MQKKIGYNTFIVFFGGIYVFLLSIIIWGVNKGVDLTDEGFFYSATRPNQEDSYGIWPFFIVLGKITTFFEPDIIFWRLTRIFLIISSSFVLAKGFILWIKSAINIHNFPLKIFYPIVGIAGLMNYSVSPQGLSYNQVTFILVQLILGFLLMYMASFEMPYGAKHKRYLIGTYLFIIGFCISTLFIVKFSSAILLLLLLLFILIIHHFLLFKTFQSRFFEELTCFLGGMILFLTILTIIYKSPIEIVAKILESRKYMADHDVKDLLLRYTEDVLSSFLGGFIFNNPIVIISPFIILLLFRNQMPKLLFVGNIIIIVLFTDFVLKNETYYKATAAFGGNSSNLYRMLIAFFIITYLLILLDKYSRQIFAILIRNRYFFFIGVVLFLLMPFICSFGTNIVPSLHITQFMSFGILMLSVSLLLLSLMTTFPYLLFSLGIFLLLINSTSQIISGFVYNPYRIEDSLIEQRYYVPNLNGNKNILFDRETCDFIYNLKSKIDKYSVDIENTPIIVFDYPGLTYLLGAKSPGFAWYYSGGYHNIQKNNCFSFKSSQMAELNKTIFIIPSYNQFDEEFIDCIKLKGVDIKNNYVITDSIYIPNKNSLNEIKMLLIYMPKISISK